MDNNYIIIVLFVETPRSLETPHSRHNNYIVKQIQHVKFQEIEKKYLPLMVNIN